MLVMKQFFRKAVSLYFDFPLNGSERKRLSHHRHLVISLFLPYSLLFFLLAYHGMVVTN